MDQKKFVNN